MVGKKKVGYLASTWGNTASLSQALVAANCRPVAVSTRADLKGINHLILGGVGSFSTAMEDLRKTDLDKTIKEFADTGGNVLGICLGMQLLFESGEEGAFESASKGLGLVPGKVLQINPESYGLQRSSLPKNKQLHVGWNKLQVSRKKDNAMDLLNHYFYFMHQYMVAPAEKSHEIYTVEWNTIDIIAVIQSKNILGCQFHPENSSNPGLKFLKYFSNLP